MKTPKGGVEKFLLMWEGALSSVNVRWSLPITISQTSLKNWYNRKQWHLRNWEINEINKGALNESWEGTGKNFKKCAKSQKENEKAINKAL